MKRWSTLLLALLVSTPVWGQVGNDAPLKLPVSMQRIREGVSQARPAEPLKGLDITSQPTFHIDVTEQQKFDELLSKITFEAPGPIVAGGIYAYEQQQRLFPPVNNPLVQPYAAFTGGQLATIGMEALLEGYVGGPAVRLIDDALKERAEREARDEVARALAAYRLAADSSTTIASSNDKRSKH